MRHFRYFLLFFIIGLLLYFPIFSAGFAADDYPQLVHQPFFHHFDAAFQVFTKVITSPTGHNLLTGFFYRPLTFALYTILYNLTQANPFYFHLFQFLLFIATVYLLFIFFTKFFPRNLSLLLAIIFLIHPANNELASYIAALADTLSLLSGLFALNLTLKPSNHPTIKQSIRIAFYLFLSLLSKETGIIFVILALIYTMTKTYARKKNPISDILHLTSLLIPLIIYLLLRINASSHSMFSYITNPQLTNPTNRLLFAPQIALTFFSEILAPTRKPLHDTFFHATFTADLLPLGALLLITSSCYTLWFWLHQSNKKNKHLQSSPTNLLLFYSWIFLGLILYLQITPLEFLFAERWLYITEIGILGTIGIIISSFHFPKNKWLTICAVLFGLLLLLYAGETIHLNFLWQDWQHHLVS